MQMIDRHRVRNAFGKQAHEYEAHAAIQKRVIARFLELLKSEGLTPRRLLDVGAGTGMLLRSLREIYRDSLLVGIDLAPGMCRMARKNLEMDENARILTADAEHLPFSSETFDLVLSTSTFQWLPTLDAAFGEACRVLVPGGTFCFTLFGEGTLHELRRSYRWALDGAGCSGEDRTHTFFSVEDVASALKRAGFTNLRVNSEQDMEIHDDVPALLRSLKRIGAGNASPVTRRGLIGKRIMAEMMGLYRKEFGSSSGIPATYGIIYGMGKKAF
jgi:malonyl-CoA O-methyltransferase